MRSSGSNLKFFILFIFVVSNKYATFSRCKNLGGEKRRKMRKELIIMTVIAVIMVSAAGAITVANMSDDQANAQRYEISEMPLQSAVSSLDVDETEPAISYDDGSAEQGFSISLFDIGHAVLFTPQPKPWTLKKVRVYGLCNVTLSNVVFALEIWDNDSNLLYKLSDYSIAYFNTTSEWTEIDIPDMIVTDDFYVCIFERGSLYVGVDEGNPAMRSYVVIRDPKGMVKEEGFNWMIRAVGA